MRVRRPRSPEPESRGDTQRHDADPEADVADDLLRADRLDTARAAVEHGLRARRAKIVFLAHADDRERREAREADDADPAEHPDKRRHRVATSVRGRWRDSTIARRRRAEDDREPAVLLTLADRDLLLDGLAL